MGAKGSKGKAKGKKKKGKNDDSSETSDDMIYASTKGEKVALDDFDLLTVIGKGSFGKVYLVRMKSTQESFALKVLRKDKIIERNQVDHTMAEKEILRRVTHPFIVGLQYAFQTPEKLYLVLDYVNGGELFFHLKREHRFSEQRVQFYAAEIALALAHLHAHQIVYRDLKPENILIDSDGHVRITDFGLSKHLGGEEQNTTTLCGTPEYLAPEILSGEAYGVAVDWWSLGTLMFEMLTGLPPFFSENTNVMYQKIQYGKLKCPKYLSEAAQSVLEGLLTREVGERLGSNGFDELQDHPFFEGIDWEALLEKEVEPPFKPKVRGDTDTSQIDPVFTSEPLVDTPVARGAAAKVKNADVFEGFSYVGGNEMGSTNEFDTDGAASDSSSTSSSS